ncbi:hypothetical protein [Yinghuangia soli]|uniref:PH domain-containing protein n=1 Tax=Yinghuangia soli TaxID=2908204 RepID=A0AA41Q766_9ACTN|nr:hypothetical protein [Yinghuangia soli]MCF2531966.1 hypothetical protein [Yinghuangia soli]
MQPTAGETSHELPVRWTRTDATLTVLGAVIVCGAIAAAVAGALSTGGGVAAVVLAALVGLLLVFSGTTAFHGPPTRHRFDAAGVTLVRGRWRGRTRDDLIPWADIEAVVVWKQRGSNWVGVVATEDYRRRTGRGQGRLDQHIDGLLGHAVSGTTLPWDGPDHELRSLYAAVAALAPDVPCLDPTDGTHWSPRPPKP